MQNLYNQSANKKATNLSINSDLLKKSKDLNINLSATLEQALRQKLAESKAEKWLKKNKNAIQTYNDVINEHGDVWWGKFGRGISDSKFLDGNFGPSSMRIIAFTAHDPLNSANVVRTSGLFSMCHNSILLLLMRRSEFVYVSICRGSIILA